MIEKQYRDRLDIRIGPGDATFRQVAAGLKCSYDEKMLQAALPPTTGVTTADKTLVRSLDRFIPEATREAITATEFVGVFGRVLEDTRWPDTRCLQYIYVWDYQGVPPHEVDYEPIFVFMNKDQADYAVYDLVHYCSRRLNLHGDGGSRQGLRCVPGWHSFLPAGSLESKSVDRLKVQPLTDQHLNSWYSIPNEESKLKIRGHLLDPFSITVPGHFLDKPDEETTTMCCTFREIERAMMQHEDPKTGLIDGIRTALAGCVGVYAIFRLGAFLQLLGEMNDVGMVSLPAAARSGISIQSMLDVLSKGFVSLTSAGKSFMEGFNKARTGVDQD